MKQNNPTITKGWFHIGDEELNFAKTSFKELDSFYPQICFQCQQAVEKYLKGFLAFYQKPFPKVHDLVSLIKLCRQVNPDFDKFIDEANILSQYYLIVRYPLEYPAANKINAQQCLEIATEIIEFTKSLISTQSLISTHTS